MSTKTEAVMVPVAELADFAHVMGDLISGSSDPGTGALAAHFRITQMLSAARPATAAPAGVEGIAQIIKAELVFCLTSEPDASVEIENADHVAREILASLRSPEPDEDGDDGHCDICSKSIKADDMCLTDVDLGPCHAACLEGSPAVNLETGELLPDDAPRPVPYRWGDTASPSEEG